MHVSSSSNADFAKSHMLASRSASPVSSVKYEEVYLKVYESVAEARAGIGAYLNFYNNERPHQALDYRTPAQVFEEGWGQAHRPAVSLTPQLVPV